VSFSIDTAKMARMLKIAAAASLLLATGWGIAGGHAKAMFLAMAILGLLALALAKRGACIGVLLLTAMNGIPFVDTSEVVVAKMTVEDLAIVALLLIASIWILLEKGARDSSRLAGNISRMGGLLLLWWLWSVARTVVSQHVPVLHATGFGRDFLYFGLLLVVLPRIRLTSRDIGALLWVLTIGVCLFAAGQIMTVTGLPQLHGLIHFERAAQQSGLTRVYAHMTDLVTAGVAVSVAAGLSARQPMARLLAGPVVLLLVTSIVLQLTRARWIGLVVGIVVVSIWLLVKGGGHLAPILRRRLALAIGVLTLAGIVGLLVVPGLASGGPVMQRLLSIAADLQTGGGSLAIREEVTRAMTSLLGRQWLVGLGFVPPSAHYFPGLPNGSLRDADVGVLNAVMTMGVLGAVLLYLPLVRGLIHCLGRSSTQWDTRYGWLRFGGAVWIVATLVSSVTLVTLFSTGGLALAAVALTVLAHPSVCGVPAPARATPARPKSHIGPAIALSAGSMLDRQPAFATTLRS
jgi:hypothetical protein